MRGRKPKPTTIRLIEGVAGHRPLPAYEPTPPVVDTPPVTPRRLGPVGRAQWQAHVSTLTASRVLTVSDIGALAELCATCEELDGLRTWLQREQRRPVKQRDVDLLLRLHSAIDRKQTVAVKLESEFGVTPSSRSRVSAERSPGLKDKLKAFQQARRSHSA